MKQFLKHFSVSDVIYFVVMMKLAENPFISFYGDYLDG